MPKAYILIGVPGSGKSTWIAKAPVDWNNTVVASTDNYVEQEAKRQGKTYSEVFEEYMPTAVKQMMVNVNMAAAFQMDIVWDQTSTTVKSRARKFNALPASLNYEHIAVVFRTPERSELDVRLAGRPGKHIPKIVIDDMIDNWEEPTLEEGFKEIWRI